MSLPGKPVYRDGSIEKGLENGKKLLESNFAAAALQARELLKSEPRNTAAHRLFAKAMAGLGHGEEARLARARAVQFSREVPAIAQAHRANMEGRPAEAEAMLRDHLALYSDDPVALLVNGEALARIGRVNEAVRQFEAALAFMPEYREASFSLMRANLQRFDIPAALKALQPLLDDRPGETALLRWKASLLSNFGDNAAAAGILERLVKADPAVAEVWVSLGDELRTLGRSKDADDAYRRAASIGPAKGRPWWGLAALGFAPLNETDRSDIQAALTKARDPDDRQHLHFALGTAFDQAGMYRDAFQQFAAGNEVRHAIEPFDPAALAVEVALSKALLAKEFFAARAGGGDPEPDPIFIVGMPRSGSTLLEQVLASHAEIEGAGELPFISVMVRIMAAEHGLGPGRSYHEVLAKLEPAELARLGAEYLRLARAHRRTDRPYFIDKLPHNWADVGFIKLILPNAKIVDVRRAPMDCCWSNYRLLFAKGHPSSNSLTGMAAYYRHYVAMMDHWDEALPGLVHRVIYERLVDDFEPEVRRLLDHLGLPFDPACLDFHTRDRAVATASAEQVRRPLNRQGIGAWKAYEEWLGPLKDAVGDLERTYDR